MKIDDFTKNKSKTRLLAAFSVLVMVLALATVSGALSDFPDQFIANGKLTNTYLVIGKDSKVEDTVAAVELAAYLQANAVTETDQGTTPTAPPGVSEGIKIMTAGNRMNYGQDIQDIFPGGFDETELPGILAREEFDDNQGDNKETTEYSQELKFLNNAGTFMFTKPEDEDAGNYLFFGRGNKAYDYSITFDDPVLFDTGAARADLEGNTLVMQGHSYTISNARSVGGQLDSLELLSGNRTVWLTQDQPFDFGNNTITVVNVDSSETQCGLDINGDLVWIDEGDSDEVNGITVSVLDVIAVHAANYDADTCEIIFGSNTIELRNGERVRIDNNEIRGSEVSFLGSSGSWEGLTISLTTGEQEEGINSDDIYLSQGQAWTDPVFGNWKIIYAGITADYEKMDFESSGEDATFSYTNIDNVDVEIPFHYDTTHAVMMLGEDADRPLLLPGESYSGDPEGVMMLYTTTTGESHVLEITRIDCSSDEITINDVTYDRTVARSQTLSQGCDTSVQTVSLGTLGNIQLVIDSDTVEYRDVASMGGSTPKSRYEAEISLSSDSIEITESRGNEEPVSTIAINLEWDTGSDEIKIASIRDNGAQFDWVDYKDNNNDMQAAVTAKGTEVIYDQDAKDSATIMHPEDDVYANVFLAPVSATVITSSSGTMVTQSINFIGTSFLVTDDVAQGLDSNMIVIGGPCVNSIAADLLGNPSVCTEGFEPGRSRLELFTVGGRTRLLVAGYYGQDTLAAARELITDPQQLSGNLDYINT